MGNTLEAINKAIKSTEDVYNRVGEGELTFSEVGDIFHTFLGDEVLTALKKAREELNW